MGQMLGLVRTREEIEKARGTHFLEGIQTATDQDMKRERSSEGTNLLERAEFGTD